MKKLLAIILSLGLILGLCGGASAAEGNPLSFNGFAESVMEFVFENGDGQIPEGDWAFEALYISDFEMLTQAISEDEEEEDGIISGEISISFDADSGLLEAVLTDLLYVDYEPGELTAFHCTEAVLSFVVKASPAGTWVIGGVLTDGREITGDALAQMGLEGYLLLEADGTGYVSLFGEEAPLDNWYLDGDKLHITAEGETVEMEYTGGGMIVWDADEATVIFELQQPVENAYIGSWGAVSADFYGEEYNSSDLDAMGASFELLLFADSTGQLHSADGESLSLVWSVTENGISIEAEGEVLEALYDGTMLTLMADEGFTISFVKGLAASNDPVGEWTAVGMDMFGMHIGGGDLAGFGVEMDLSINEDGTGFLTANGESATLTWSYDPESAILTLQAEGEDIDLQISYTEEDLLILTEGEEGAEDLVSITFARIGSEYYEEAMNDSSLMDMIGGLS